MIPSCATRVSGRAVCPTNLSAEWGAAPQFQGKSAHAARSHCAVLQAEQSSQLPALSRSLGEPEHLKVVPAKVTPGVSHGAARKGEPWEGTAVTKCSPARAPPVGSRQESLQRTESQLPAQPSTQRWQLCSHKGAQHTLQVWFH